ncbi:DUF1456 family protein [Alteromonas macleodii]|uniref:DUF1456 family protein n=1 Tax=Alteromonas macleodii TaxID=28108 RepID=UPI0031402BE2
MYNIVTPSTLIWFHYVLVEITHLTARDRCEWPSSVKYAKARVALHFNPYQLLATPLFRPIFMIHNDVLRRLRYALAINDTAAISIFKLVNYDMEIDYLHAVMKREGEEGYLPCRDKIIALFLDGLIIKNRGRQEGQMPQELGPKERLSNNEVLRKIRIAMSYKDDDMIAVLKLADFRISKGELSAFFRKPDHRNFKPAGDQVVRNLLQGMVKKYRPESTRQTSPKKSDTPSTSGTKPGSFNKGASKQNEAAGKNTNTKVSSVKKSDAGSVWGKLPKK